MQDQSKSHASCEATVPVALVTVALNYVDFICDCEYERDHDAEYVNCQAADNILKRAFEEPVFMETDNEVASCATLPDLWLRVQDQARLIYNTLNCLESEENARLSVNGLIRTISDECDEDVRDEAHDALQLTLGRFLKLLACGEITEADLTTPQG